MAATKQIAFIFLIPVPVSTIQTFVVLKPMLEHIRLTYDDVTTVTITVSLVFLAIQSIYFIIARSRYVQALQKITDTNNTYLFQ